MKQRTIGSVLLTAMLVMLMAVPVFAQDAPSVEVSDQAVVEGTVTIDSVNSEGPGWLVIHADADGKPGPVIGYSAVEAGENADVAVDIDTEAATPVLHAMLHVDEGTVGTYEFPGPDAPARVDDAVVNVPFNTGDEMMADEEMAEEEESAEEGDMADEEMSAEEDAADEEMADEEMMDEEPSITVSDQDSDGTMVTVDSVYASQDGWMVIHADADGSPGPVLGQTAVPAGMTENVIVILSETIYDDTTLWAMLHVDEGEVGLYEFPGADGPVRVNDAVVTLPFTASAPAMMEEEMTEEGMAEEEEMAEEEMAEEEMADDAMMEEDAKGDDGMMADDTKGDAPKGMPDTGASPVSAPVSVAMVILAVVALAGGAFATRRRQV